MANTSCVRLSGPHVAALLTLSLSACHHQGVVVYSPLRPVVAEAFQAQSLEAVQTISLDQPVYLRLSALAQDGRKISLKPIQWVLENAAQGELRNGVFTPARPGLVKIIGKVGDFSKECLLQVLSPATPAAQPGPKAEAVPALTPQPGTTPDDRDVVPALLLPLEATGRPDAVKAFAPFPAVASPDPADKKLSEEIPPVDFTFSPRLHVSHSRISLPGPDAGTQLDARVTDENGHRLAAEITWYSEDPSIAVVSNGYIIAKGQGQTTIIARALGQEVRIPVTVESRNEISRGSEAAAGPSIQGISPAAGAPNLSPVTISGKYFGSSQGASKLSVGGNLVTAQSWSDTSIVMALPEQLPAGSITIMITVAGKESNPVSLTINAPVIASATPAAGVAGSTDITLSGQYFGSSQGSSRVTLGGQDALVRSWSNTEVVVTAPATLPNGVHAIEALVGPNRSNTNFTFSVLPQLSHVNNSQCLSGVAGDTLTLGGVNFGSTPGKVLFGAIDVSASITSWSPASISLTLPGAATVPPGVYALKVEDALGNQTSTLNFFVRDAAVAVLPVAGGTITAATPFMVTGSGFGCSAGTVEIGGFNASANILQWFDNAIHLSAPHADTVAGTHINWSLAQSSGAAVVTAPITVRPRIELPPANAATVDLLNMRILGRGFNAALANVSIQIFALDVSNNCDPVAPLAAPQNPLAVSTGSLVMAGTQATADNKCAIVTVNGAASAIQKLQF